MSRERNSSLEMMPPRHSEMIPKGRSSVPPGVGTFLPPGKDDLQPDKIRGLPFHALDTDIVISKVQGNFQYGLSSAQVSKRRAAFGPNVLPSGPDRTFLMSLWREVNSVLIYVLIVGGILSFIFGHIADGVVIFCVVIINVTVGMIMEGRAADSTAILQAMMSAQSTVRRDGEKLKVNGEDLVVGDILFLKPGDVVGADARIINSAELKVLESALTGESHPISKSEDTVTAHSRRSIQEPVEDNASDEEKFSLDISRDRVDSFSINLGGSQGPIIDGSSPANLRSMSELPRMERADSLFVTISERRSARLSRAAIAIESGRELDALSQCHVEKTSGKSLQQYLTRSNSARTQFMAGRSNSWLVREEDDMPMSPMAVSMMSMERGREQQQIEENTIAEMDVPLADRTSIVYSGTQVIKGTAQCIVIAVGRDCEMGRIGELLQETKEMKTPLLQQLEVFGRFISFIILIIAIAALGAALGRGYYIGGAMGIAIGVAVAAIPEGLPSCVTVAFSKGVSVMAKKHAIIKSLPAVETLGSVGVICSDKTGTLTQNMMTVKVLCSSGHFLKLSNEGTVEQTVPISETDTAPDKSVDMKPYLAPGLFCNDASIKVSSMPAEQNDIFEETKMDDGGIGEMGDSDYSVSGEPTEKCLMQLGCQIYGALQLKQMLSQYHRVGVIPFDSSRKYMMAAYELPTHLINSTLGIELDTNFDFYNILFLKGAVERVGPFLRETSSNESPPATSASILPWSAHTIKLAEQGMRVLCLAYKVLDRNEQVSLEREVASPCGFTATSLAGIIDPPRSEAVAAVECAHQAGISVKMITGDHPVTALAIGQQLGLQSETAITGAQLDRLIAGSDLAFDKAVLGNDIFARTTPEHKLRIVQSLQRQGIVCGMTGDGVNDAPALKAANIGVAMGITGTEVAKDAANMIITDDNFATIVDAVRIGRCTYNNLVKILAFCLPTNGGQAFSIIMALIIDVAVPITALQILWVNMVTSITLGLVLAFEKPHPSIMTLDPRPPDKPIFGSFLKWRVLFVTILLVAAVLGIFHWEKQRISSTRKLRTIAVNTLAIAQSFYLFNCRHLRSNASIPKMYLGNRWVWLGIFALAAAQVIFTYAPPLQYVFQTSAIDGISWAKIILFGVVISIAVEIEKFVAEKLRNYREARYQSKQRSQHQLVNTDAFEEL